MNNNILPKTNTGLIPGFSKKIWLGGKIPYVVNNPKGDWRDYNVAPEKQKDPVECMGCVTFSLLNNYEIQHKFNGVDINLSDRFTAKVSGTQMNGNTFEAVIDSTRNIGVVREETWPNKPKAQTWAEYYKDIPQSVISKAVKVQANYEIVPRATDWSAQLQKFLKQSPLWITWPKDPYHAMTLMYVNKQDAYVKDHYRDIKKVPVSDIAIAAVVQLNQLINFNKMDNIVIYKKGSEYQLAHKAISEEGLAQQLFDAGALHLVKEDGKPNFEEIDKTVINL